MRSALLLLMAMVIGCGGTKVKVRSAPEVEVCDSDFVMNHIVATTGCSTPAVYMDPMAPLYYGVCEDAGDLLLVSVIFPTPVYEEVSELVEADGGKIICSDPNFTVVTPPQ